MSLLRGSTSRSLIARARELPTEMQPEAGLGTSLGFSSRADQIFGALGGSTLEGASEGKKAPWTVSQDTVFRSSKEAYSSDEDEEAKEMDRRQKEFLPESMTGVEG